jgi:hypothetical protein
MVTLLKLLTDILRPPPTHGDTHWNELEFAPPEDASMCTQLFTLLMLLRLFHINFDPLFDFITKDVKFECNMTQ